MTDPDIFECIARSLTGRQKPGDHEFLRAWCAESEENHRIFDALEKNWCTPFMREYEVLGSEEVRDNLVTRARKEKLFTGAGRRRVSWDVFYKAAAVFVVLLVSALVLYFLVPWSETEQIAVKMIERENAPGRRSVIHLKDGSTVYLNAASSIRYPEVFSDSSRIIYLRGEAFFDVAHNPAKPFIVQCDHLAVIALGTTFNVDSYTAKQTVEVSLLSGKVKVVSTPGNALPADDQGVSCILHPGEQVSLNRTENRLDQTTSFNEEEVIAWKQGVLHFQGADMPTLLRKLELWYGVSIEVANPMHVRASSMCYTGKFRDQNLQNVLESIGFVQHFDYAINEQNITIRFH